MAIYTAHIGERFGQSDDEQSVSGGSLSEAMAEAIRWAREAAPESDEAYQLIVWLVDDDGEFVADETIIID